MSVLILNKTQYRPNIAIDMVLNCIRHYKRFEKPLKEIILDHALFHKWREGMLERDETLEIIDRMEFKDVTIKRGSKFMSEPLIVTFKDLVAK